MNDTYLALDIGEARIGLAVGSVVPFGRGTTPAKDRKQALGYIQHIVEEEQITRIIVGLPEVPSGDYTESYKLALAWIDILKDAFPGIPVSTVNEAFSSVAAEQQLREAGIDTRLSKDKIDERSAELILAQYLAEKKL